MYYASFAQGYEAGGYNALSPGATYQPEKVKNYEVGVKSELFDRRLLVNASVYYYIYSNLQNLESGLQRQRGAAAVRGHGQRPARHRRRLRDALAGHRRLQPEA